MSQDVIETIKTNKEAIKKMITNIINYDREYASPSNESVEDVVDNIYLDVLGDLQRSSHEPDHNH